MRVVKNLSKKIRQLHQNPIVSMVVLLGFLCIQFHSLSHIHSHSLSASDYSGHSANSTSQISEHSTSYIDVVQDCTDCVLTKQFQADLQQSTIEYFDDKSTNTSSIAVISSVDFFNYSYNLRAPPSISCLI